MSSATFAVIIFIAITVALFAVVEVKSRRRGRRDPVVDGNEERDAA